MKLCNHVEQLVAIKKSVQYLIGLNNMLMKVFNCKNVMHGYVILGRWSAMLYIVILKGHTRVWLRVKSQIFVSCFIFYQVGC